MRRLAGLLARIFAVALFVVGADAAAITFDDGLVHVIDAGNSYPFDKVYVYDGPSSIATTVEVVTDGEVGTLLPGFPHSIQAFENSIINIYGGRVGWSMEVNGSSVVNISGGLIERTLFVYGAGADLPP
jgi:hypothetical protein